MHKCSSPCPRPLGRGRLRLWIPQPLPGGSSSPSRLSRGGFLHARALHACGGDPLSPKCAPPPALQSAAGLTECLPPAPAQTLRSPPPCPCPQPPLGTRPGPWGDTSLEVGTGSPPSPQRWVRDPSAFPRGGWGDLIPFCAPSSSPTPGGLLLLLPPCFGFGGVQRFGPCPPILAPPPRGVKLFRVSPCRCFGVESQRPIGTGGGLGKGGSAPPAPTRPPSPPLSSSPGPNKASLCDL